MKIFKNYIVIAGIIVIIAGLVVYNNWRQTDFVDDPKIETFALCLKEKGVTMYGAYWCPHCQRQKEMFGPYWKHISYIECSLPGGRGQTQLCSEKGITGYPTWEFEGKKRVEGELNFNELLENSGCPGLL